MPRHIEHLPVHPVARVVTYARLAGDAYNDTGTAQIDGFARIPHTTLGKWSSPHGSDFFAACYHSHQTGVVSIRGTVPFDRKSGDLSADLDLALLHYPTAQLHDAFDMFRRAKELFEGLGTDVVVVTGHSLGGALAQVIAASVTASPVVGVSFDAPGAAGLTGGHHVSDANAKNVYNYRAARDAVSEWGTHIGRRVVSVKTDSMELGVIGAELGALVGGPIGAEVGGGIAHGVSLYHYHSIKRLIDALTKDECGHAHLTWTPGK